MTSKAYTQLMKQNEALRQEQLNLHRKIAELKSELRQEKDKYEECRDEFFNSIIQLDEKSLEYDEERRGLERERLIQHALCLAVINNNKYQLHLIEECLRKKNQTFLDLRCCNHHKDVDHSCNLLVLAAVNNNMEIFDYLCTPENIILERGDCGGKSIVDALSELSNDYYVSKYIEIGASTICKQSAEIPLHEIIDLQSTKIVLKLIEAGMDVNVKDQFGSSPLYWACFWGYLEEASMFLAYGAEVNVSSHRRGTAFDTAVDYRHFEIANMLFDYSFHEDEVNNLHFETFLKLFKYNDLPELRERVKNCKFKIVIDDDISNFYLDLDRLDCDDFQFILNTYSDFVSEFIEDSSGGGYSIFNLKLDATRMDSVTELKNFCSFVKSDYITQAIDISYEVSYRVIGETVLAFKQFDYPLSLLHEIVLILLSHGIVIYTDEIELIFEHYSYCELFSELLHMELVKVPEYIHFGTILMARVISQMSFDINMLVCDMFFAPKDKCLLDLLHFFAHPHVKEYCSSWRDKTAIIEKLQQMPVVPTLLELAREGTRKSIVKRFNATSSSRFYTILNAMQIPQTIKDIISYKIIVY